MTVNERLFTSKIILNIMHEAMNSVNMSNLNNTNEKF